MKKLLVLLIAIVCASMLFASGGGETNQESSVKTIEWWDHFMPLAEMHQKIFSECEKELGIPIVYTQYDPAKQTESLLLAFRTGSTPDVFSKTMPVSEAALYEEGWFSPMSVERSDLPQYMQDALFEGYTMFDGKIYSLPLMSIMHCYGIETERLQKVMFLRHLKRLESWLNRSQKALARNNMVL